MKRKPAFGFALLAALGLILAGCGGEADDSGTAETSDTAGGTTATTTSSERVLQSITIDDEYKEQTVGIGEVVAVSSGWYTLDPLFGLSDEEREIEVTIDEGAEYFEEGEDGFTAIALGEATFRISSVKRPEIYDTFEIEVIDTFFARTDNYSYYDLTHENDEENPYVTSRGLTGNIMVRGIEATKWYAETEITIQSISSSESYSKFGIFSRLADSWNRIYIFIDAYTANGNYNWTNFGIVEVDGEHDWAWNSGITNDTARHNDAAYVLSESITYHDTFKMGMARNGSRHYMFIDGAYACEFDILESLMTAEDLSNVGFFQFNATARFGNYYATQDETEVDEILAAIAEPNVITEWADD